MACAICSNLVPETLKYLRPGQLAPIFVNEYELLVSAQCGTCAECVLLYDAISTKRREWASSKQQSQSIIINIAVGKPIQIIWIKAGIFLYIFRPESSTGIEGATDIPAVIGEAHLVPRDSGSEECLALLQSWFSDCKASHALCQQKKTTLLPTRVLDVGSSLSTTADLSLIETSGVCGEYMALSYCWGDPKFHHVLKTTCATLDQFSSQITFKSMPLTLQHAILLARRLKIRYVWIDALCIIQDDENDWKTEAAKMCEVYSGASITIIACRSNGSSGGIFGIQAYGTFTQIPYKQYFVNVSDDYGRDHDYNVLLHERYVLDPIHTRAWTMQEAILSNRAVFFTSQELRWDCNTCRHCQCGKLSKRFPETYDEEEIEYEMYRMWRLNKFFPAASVEKAYNQWYQMYSFYTGRVLTNDNDRLVALSGLARRFAEIMEANFGRKEQYLAGIWLGSLPRDLLWTIEDKGLSRIKNRRHERPKVWRAPSWSWASMEADASRFRYGDLQSRVHVLQASTELAGLDPYGQVREGALNYLKIRGPLLRDIRFNYDASTFGPLQRRFPTISWQGKKLRQARVSIDDDLGEETDRFLDDTGQNFAILVIGYSPGSDVHDSLVLKAVVGKEETFERIGLVVLGPHIREPEEHRKLVEEAPCHTIILV